MGAGSSRLAVLAFTDVVDSTGLKTRLGDAAAGKLLAQHSELVHQALADAGGGTILKDTGDGYLLQFATPSDAVRFALLLQYKTAHVDWGPQAVAARIGVHVGEVFQGGLEPDGTAKLVGLAVDTAARVTSLAQPRQILLTAMAFDSARHNVREHPPVNDQTAPQIRWISHGPYQLRGLKDPIQICEVGAVGIAPLSSPSDGENGRPAMAAAAPTTPPAAITYATPQPSRRAGRWVLAILLVIVVGGALLLVAGLLVSGRPTVVPLPKTVNASPLGTTNATRQGNVSPTTEPTTMP